MHSGSEMLTLALLIEAIAQTSEQLCSLAEDSARHKTLPLSEMRRGVTGNHVAIHTDHVEVVVPEKVTIV